MGGLFAGKEWGWVGWRGGGEGTGEGGVTGGETVRKRDQ